MMPGPLRALALLPKVVPVVRSRIAGGGHRLVDEWREIRPENALHVEHPPQRCLTAGFETK